MPEPYSEDGCFYGMIVVACWFAFCVLAALSLFISDCSGLEFDTIFGWLFGTILAAGMVLGLIVAPIVRFCFLVTVTAILLIALLLAVSDGDQEILDTGWAKALVVTVSVGIGAVYLLWETSRAESS